jgi:hypothetical protein
VSEANFKDKLAGDLDARYTKLLEVIDQGLEATKKVWATCQKCGKRTEVEITDTRGAIEAANFIASHAHGRPGIASDGSAEDRVIFVRVRGGSDAARIYEAALKFVPEELHDEFHLEAAYRPSTTTKGNDE